MIDKEVPIANKAKLAAAIAYTIWALVFSPIPEAAIWVFLFVPLAATVGLRLPQLFRELPSEIPSEQESI